MKKTYFVALTNHQGATFDSTIFTNLRKARIWAAGRGETFEFGKWHKYRVEIYKNENDSILAPELVMCYFTS